MSMLPAIIEGGEKALAKTGGSALSKVIAKGAENAGRNIAIKAIGKAATKIPVITSSNPMTLQNAYDKLISLKKATSNNAQKQMNVLESGLKPNIQVSDDFLNASKGSYLKSLQDNYDLALKNDLGKENALELKRAIEPFTSIGGNYEEAKKRAMDYIASGKSNKVTENSSKLLGDKNIFRSKNSDTGISWTLDPSVAKEYAYNVDNPIFQRARTGGDAVLIAPQYTERYQPSAMVHNEVIGYPYGINNIKNIDSARNGNFGHKGVKGMRGGSAPKV